VIIDSRYLETPYALQVSSRPDSKAPADQAVPPATGPAPAVPRKTPAAVPPPRPLPPSAGRLASKVLPEMQRGGVVHGARRSDEPEPLPPSKKLPSLPPPPSNGTPTPLPPAPDDLLEVDVAAPERAPSEPPRRASAPQAQQLPAICTYGRYEILGRIAFGGMAEIFLGRESHAAGSGRMVAVKRILPHVADDPSFVEMFLDEARLAIQLSHPNICHIYEFGELEDTYFIAMEWIHGAPLGKVIRRARDKGGLAPELVAKILAQVAEALHYAHRARDANGQPLGIVHRDVTPHNVMVSYGGQVKLLDFGIAKATTASTKTEAGVVKGKFAYMSPQQCVGQPVDARADVFALGVVMYEALTGKSLYQRPTDYETMKAVIEEPVPSTRAVRPELPQALDEIVQKALQKAPDDRWRSAEAMQQALEEWLVSTGKSISTGKVATLMDELFADELRRGPLLDSTPFGQSFRRRKLSAEDGSSASGARALPADAIASGKPSSSRGALVGVGIALAMALVAGVAWFAGRSTSGPSTTEPPSTVAAPHEAEPDEPAPVPPETTALAEPPEPPPSTPTEAPARGRIVVRGISATGTTVLIGGAAVEDGMTGHEVEPGHHVVRVEHGDRRPFELEVDVEPGEEEIVTVEAEARVAARPPGRLSINTRPWSKVYVGSRLLGTTPIADATIQSGTVRLRLVDRDGLVFTRTITVPPNAETRMFYNLRE